MALDKEDGGQAEDTVKMAKVVIGGAVRTPLGKGSAKNGALREIHPERLLATVLEALVARTGIEPGMVEDVVVGCVSQVGEQAFNVARQGTLLAGFPVEVPATTVDRQCGSSEQALHLASAMIACGQADMVIAAGVESMSRVPMGSSIAVSGTPFPDEFLAMYPVTNQGIAAERVAEKWVISRADADRFALLSQQRAAAAASQGRFDKEIVPVRVQQEGGEIEITADQGIRPETTLEGLAQLSPAFRPGGILHAGNSSQITDGAAAVLLLSEERARALSLAPLARIAAWTTVGVDPVLMLTGPIPATSRVLQRAGLLLEDIDRVEINEAFAPVVLAWEKEHHPDMAKVNVNGGAIALGHPLGASGARLMTTLLHELLRSGLRRGLQTMCCGGGLGTATVIDLDV